MPGQPGWRHQQRADLTEEQKIRYLEDDADRFEMLLAQNAGEVENDIKDIKAELKVIKEQAQVDRSAQKDRDNKILVMMLAVALTVVASVISIIITLVVT